MLNKQHTQRLITDWLVRILLSGGDIPSLMLPWGSMPAKTLVKSAGNLNLSKRVDVIRVPTSWAQEAAVKYHYKHKRVFDRADPFGYGILLDGNCVGFMIVATPQHTKQKGLFGYPGLPTQWQVLTLSRLWLHPSVQGQTVVDSNGKTHSLTVASCALSKMLKRVQRDWLEHHPPPYPDEPYHIRLLLSYAEIEAGHDGKIYKVAGFESLGSTVDKKKLIFVKRLKEPSCEAPLFTPPLFRT